MPRRTHPNLPSRSKRKRYGRKIQSLVDRGIIERRKP